MPGDAGIRGYGARSRRLDDNVQTVSPEDGAADDPGCSDDKIKSWLVAAPPDIGIPSKLKSKQSFRISVGDFFTIRAGNRNLIQKCDRFRHRSVRIVGRKHDSICADFGQQILEGRRKIESGESIMNILPEIFRRRALQFCRSSGLRLDAW